MTSLRDALAKANVVSERTVKEAEAMEAIEREAAGQALQQRVMATQAHTLEDLKDATIIREFRDKARKLLVERPDLVNQVITLAHRFKDQPGGKRLVWLVFSVRDQLGHVPGPERDRFLRRAFRNKGATMEVPDLADGGQ